MVEKPSEISDYHERLGVSRNADADEIKKAYRTQVLKYHPDRNIGNEEKSALEFAAINEAYGVLTRGNRRVINDNSVWEVYENHKKEYEVAVGKIKNSFQYAYYNKLFSMSSKERNDFVNGIFFGANRG
jgi:curved DNA-binding protein CbpA